MDELSQDLMRLVEDTRSADDPTHADARRVGAALSAVIPGFVPIGWGLAETTSQAAQGSALKGVWLGSVASAKAIGLLLTVAVAGTVFTMQQGSPEPAAPAAKVATQKVDRARAAEPAETMATEVRAVREPEAAGTDAAGPKNAAPAVTRRANGKASAKSTGRSELELVQGALGALHHREPGQAERLLLEHAARFPSGQLATEREGLIVIALCEQGRLDEAQPRKSDFLQRNPTSPLTARVERACRQRTTFE